MDKVRKYLVLLFSVLLLAACSEETVDIAGEALNYEELQAEIEEAEDELASVNEELAEKQDELTDVESELEENKEKYEGLEELANNKD